MTVKRTSRKIAKRWFEHHIHPHAQYDTVVQKILRHYAAENSNMGFLFTAYPFSNEIDPAKDNVKAVFAKSTRMFLDGCLVLLSKQNPMEHKDITTSGTV